VGAAESNYCLTIHPVTFVFICTSKAQRIGFESSRN